MDRFLRPSGAAYLVVAAVLIGLLAGLPSWAAKSSAKTAQGAPAPTHGEHKPMTAAEHAAGGHEPTAHKDAIERGQHMYVQYCASCHGDAGKGDGQGGANLAVKPQDLTVGAVVNPLPD